MIGKGMTVSDALKELAAQRKIAEGYLTTRALQEVANKLGISAPLLNILTNILFADAPVKESVHLFFSAQ
jgi:glycerol-3-phosphate dehydrogenase